MALRWLQAHGAGATAPGVLPSTNPSVLDVVPLETSRELAVDVPADPGALG